MQDLGTVENVLPFMQAYESIVGMKVHLPPTVRHQVVVIHSMMDRAFHPERGPDRTNNIILADEVGLGKTVIVLGFIALLLYETVRCQTGSSLRLPIIGKLPI